MYIYKKVSIFVPVCLTKENKHNYKKTYKMNNKTTFTRTVMALLLALFCISGIWAEDITEKQALEQALDFLAKQQVTPGKPNNNQ